MTAAPITATIGREQEIAEVQRLLADRTNRHLTLWGTGGVGKSHLAAAALAGLGSGRPVVTVDVRSRSTRAGLIDAVVRGLGWSREGAEGELLAALVSEGPDGVVLFLDGCEHAPEVRREIDPMLAVLPSWQVLATSQTPTRSAGEHLIPIEPLRPADAQGLLTALLGRRGQTVSPEDAAVLADAVGHLPLALELVAARLAVLTPSVLLARLSRDAAALGSTFPAAIASAVEGLTPPARALHGRLSVCHTSLPLSLAEAIAPAGHDPVDLLAELLTASLLVRADRGDEPRYRQLDLVRADAHQRMHVDAAEASLARREHRRWVVALADAIGDATSTTEAAAVRTAAPEAEEIERVFEECLAAGAEEDLDAAARIGAGCWRLWESLGRCQRALPLVEAALEATSATAPDPAVRSRLALGANALSQAVGDLDGAVSHAQTACAEAQRAGDRRALLRARLGLAAAHLYRGSFTEALAEGGAARTLAVEDGDSGLTASCDSMMGTALRGLNRFAESVERFDAALAATPPTSRSYLVALHNKGAALRELDRREEMFANSTEAVRCARESGNRSDLALVMVGLGDAALATGRWPEARLALDEAVVLAEEASFPAAQTAAQAFLVELAVVLDDRGAGLAAGQALLRTIDSAPVDVPALTIVQDLGLLAEGLVPDDLAATAAGASAAAVLNPDEQISTASSALDAARNHLLLRLRERLGPEAFDAAAVRGAALDRVQLLDLGRRVVEVARAGLDRKVAASGGLSPRELEVLRLVARGDTDKEIAATLGISRRTVTTHVAHILRKMGMPTRTAAAAAAREHDLVSFESQSSRLG